MHHLIINDPFSIMSKIILWWRFGIRGLHPIWVLECKSSLARWAEAAGVCGGEVVYQGDYFNFGGNLTTAAQSAA